MGIQRRPDEDYCELEDPRSDRAVRLRRSAADLSTIAAGSTEGWCGSNADRGRDSYRVNPRTYGAVGAAEV